MYAQMTATIRADDSAKSLGKKPIRWKKGGAAGEN